MPRVPITIVTGFLGSGKTTIITHMIEHLVGLQMKVAYVKNELGFEDLDAELIKGISPNVSAHKITSGKLRHTPLGQFSNQIAEIIQEEHPDKIILETAGTEVSADPVSLAVMADSNPYYYRDGMFKIVDVANFEGYDQLEDYTIDKAKLVDIVVLNKVELVDQQRRMAVIAYIREYNQVSPIIEAHQGIINPLVAFGFAMQPTTDAPPKVKLYGDDISAVNYISEKVFAKEKIESAFMAFPKTVFRCKGFVKTPAGFAVFNGVHKRFEWLDSYDTSAVTQTKLIIVGFDIEKSQDQIFALLDACTVDPTSFSSVVTTPSGM